MSLIFFIAADIPSFLIIFMNLYVIDLSWIDIAITNVTLFTNIMSSERLILFYISFTSVGI